MSFNLNEDSYPRAGDAAVVMSLTGDDAGLARPTALIYSPEWWRQRLLGKLSSRLHGYDRLQAFYDGDQPLMFASEKFRQTFGARYPRLPANFMPLVVEAERERMIVQGFRFANRPEGDKVVWGIWQDNQLDAESQIAHEMALVKGVAYTMTVPGPNGPEITIEDPCEAIVETAPGNRRKRLAGLKAWEDDDGHMRAFLFLPDFIYKWRSVQARSEGGGSWDYRQTRWEPAPDPDEDWPIANPLKVVPLVPLLNRPKRDGTGRSEIEPVIGNQNAINKLRFDALVASEFVAFPQRWAINIEVPVSPETGKPIQPFKPGIDNLWTARRPTPDEASEYGDKVPVPSFGQFETSDLSPYINMIQEEVGQMSSISRTPYHYLLGTPSSVPPSGESLKSSEAPLVKKVVAESVHLGEGWEETMRLALIASGQSAKAKTDGETIWADPETRNEAARTDSILKQYAQGLLDDRSALEELGYSSQQIERIMNAKEAEKAAKAAAAPPTPPPAPNQPTIPGAPGAQGAVVAAETQ